MSKFGQDQDQNRLLLSGFMEMAVGELRWRCRRVLPASWPTMFMIAVRGSQQGDRREKMANGNHYALRIPEL